MQQKIQQIKISELSKTATELQKEGWFINALANGAPGELIVVFQKTGLANAVKKHSCAYPGPKRGYVAVVKD